MTAYLPSFLRRPDSIFEPPPSFYIFLFHPLSSIFTFLHNIFLRLRGISYQPTSSNAKRFPIRVTCISDTHSKIPSQQLPAGDLLIHAGDLTNLGTLSQIQQAIDWLKTLQKPWPGSSEGFRHIVVIAGNHDSYFDPRSRSAHDKRNEHTRKLDWGKIIYLQHNSVTLPFPGDPLRMLKVYGAPQIPKCGGKEFAFQYARGQDAWTDTVPEDVDVLITHNPPKWHLDIPENGGLGCEHELKECWRAKPTLHVFGHIHSGHGIEYLWWDEGQEQLEEMRRHVYGGREIGSVKENFILGPFAELLDVKLILIGLRMLWADLQGLLWTRVWGGGVRNGSILVNAALTYRTTEKLRNKAQTAVL